MHKMKSLVKCGCRAIGILDERNYVVFDHTKPKRKKRKGVETIEYDYSYFGRLDQAVKEVARLAADEQSEDLRDWLKQFNATIDDLTGLFSARGSLSTLEGYSLVAKPKKTSSPGFPLAQSDSNEQEQAGGEA